MCLGIGEGKVWDAVGKIGDCRVVRESRDTDRSTTPSSNY